MARNIQPSQSGLGGRVGPLIGAIFSVGFWLALAALLPPPLVAQFSPELAPWVAIACYALALYSLVVGLRHLRGMVGNRSRRPLARSAASKSAPTKATATKSRGQPPRQAAANAPRSGGAIAARRPPTVQRMR